MKYIEFCQTSSIILEGGNVFKSLAGDLLTTRIALKDIVPTIKWLERMVHLPLLNNTLGSVGHKATSGDLDIGVESKYKQQLYAALVDWAEQQGFNSKDYIRRSGISIHFKTPIMGNVANGYVQTDFMFGDSVDWLKFVIYSPGDRSQFTGSDRNIALASLAKHHGLKLSQTQGLVSRSTGKVISMDPDRVAVLLLGPNATQEDTHSVENIIHALKNNNLSVGEIRSQLEDFVNNLSNIQFNQPLADVAIELITS
jgi:hypothetical protein